MSLRGREGVVIFINDKPTFLAKTDLVNYLKSIPSGSLEKVEIMTNPPARYNAEGSAGIINIKTRKLTKEGFNGNLTLNYGQGRYLKSNDNLILNYRKSKINVFSNVSYSRSTNYYEVDRDRFFDNPSIDLAYLLRQNNFESNGRNGYRYQLGFDYDIAPSSSIGFTYNGLTDSYKERGLYINESISESNLDSITRSGSNLNTSTNSSAFNLNARHKFKNTEKELSLNFDFLDYKNHRRQNLSSSSETGAGAALSDYDLLSLNPLNARIVGGRLDFNDKIWNSFMAEAGLQSVRSTRSTNGNYYDLIANEERLNADLTNYFRYKEFINAGYISLQRDFKRFSVKVGLRLENTIADVQQDNLSNRDSTFHLNYTNLFPTFYFLYKLDSAAKSTLTFSFGRRISRPNYQDLNPSFFYFDRNTSYSGNALLTPQYSTNFELTYSRGRLLSLGIQYNRDADVISQVSRQVSDNFMHSYFNIDHASTAGINLSSSLSFGKTFLTNVFMQLANTKYKGFVNPNHSELIDTDCTTFRLNNNNQFNIGKGWSGELVNSYRTSVIYGQTIIKPLYQMHLVVQKKFNSKVALNLGVRDVFHSNTMNRVITANFLNVSSSTKTDSRFANLSFVYSFGRSQKRIPRKSSIESEESRF